MAIVLNFPEKTCSPIPVAPKGKWDLQNVAFIADAQLAHRDELYDIWGNGGGWLEA